MLRLKRKIGEALIINENIEITVLSVTKNGVNLGILFPSHAQVLRKEVFLKIQQENLNSSKIDVALLSQDSNKIDE